MSSPTTKSTILYAKTELGDVPVRPDSRQVMLKASEGHPVQVESTVDYSKLYQVFERLRTTSDGWANLALVRRQIGTSRWLLYVLPKSETPPAVKYDENYDPKRGRYKRYAKQLAAGEALTFTAEAEAIKGRCAWRLHVPAAERRHLAFTLRRIVKSNTWIALVTRQALVRLNGMTPARGQACRAGSHRSRSPPVEYAYRWPTPSSSLQIWYRHIK